MQLDVIRVTLGMHAAGSPVMFAGGFTDKGKKRRRSSVKGDLKNLRDDLRWSIFPVIDKKWVSPVVSDLYPGTGKVMDAGTYLTLVQPILSAFLDTSPLARKFTVKQIQDEAKKMVQRRREHHNKKRNTPLGCAPLVYTAIDLTLSEDEGEGEVHEIDFQADASVDPDHEVECSNCSACIKISEAMPKVARVTKDVEKYSLFCDNCWEEREKELYLMLGIRKPKKRKQVKAEPKNKGKKASETKDKGKTGKTTPRNKGKKASATKNKGKTGKTSPKQSGKTPPKQSGKAVRAANASKKQVQNANTPEKSCQTNSQTPTRARSKQASNKKTFVLGDAVVARWTDGRFYAAHICKVGHTGHTYFPTS